MISRVLEEFRGLEQEPLGSPSRPCETSWETSCEIAIVSWVTSSHKRRRFRLERDSAQESKPT